LNIAIGTEYRIDNYQIFAGEEGSWKNYGVVDTVKNGIIVPVDTLGRPGGSQGFPGFRPDNIVDEYRTNIAAYTDVELDITKGWMIAAALRFENYSDFGSTTSLKFASRYKVTDDLSVRASVSTGFRAPSLAQIHFNSTFTDFVAGVPVDKLIAKSNSAITRTLGIQPLKEETSQSISGGVTYSPLAGLTATVDGYYVSINDRIVLTGAFDQSDPDIGGDLTALNVGAAQFFANALDTKTTGVDVILSYMTAFDEHQFHLSYAGNFNSMKLGTIKTSPKLAGKEETFFGKREQKFLLASAPTSKMSVSLDYTMERFHASTRVVHFGEVILTGWDNTDLKFDAAVTADVSAGYDLTESTALIIGVSNLFDTYPTQMPDPNNTESGGLWEAVQMGFSGRFMFAKLHITL
jgi:iron complex outermembrane receptor protein